MNWIKVSKKVPKKGQLVLVRGNRETELDSSFGRVDQEQNRIGLVRWESRNYSRTSDMCYYEIVYSKITEWVAVEDSELIQIVGNKRQLKEEKERIEREEGEMKRKLEAEKQELEQYRKLKAKFEPQ